jgi:phosphoribosylglycinamide formyltransferase 1
MRRVRWIATIVASAAPTGQATMHVGGADITDPGHTPHECTGSVVAYCHRVSKVPVVVLASGTGTLLQALLDATADPVYPARVVAVGSDRDDAGALDRIAATGGDGFALAPRDFADRAAWDAALADRIAAYRPAFVVSAGFMRLLGAAVLARFDRIVNTHPALLPSFPGAHAVRDALAYGVKVTGCSVILVDEGVDAGPILAQRPVDVLDGDDEDVLHERIKVVERELLVDVVGRMCRGGWTVTDRRVSFRD